MAVRLAPATDIELSLGAWPGLSGADKDRVRAARAALVKALAGDDQALAYLQTTSPATAAGKEAFSRALAVYAVHLAALPAPAVSAAPLPAPAPHPVTQEVPQGFAHLPPVPLAPHIVGPGPLGGVLIDPVIQAPVLLGSPAAGTPYVPAGVTATVPGVLFPVTVGSTSSWDGGVISGPPAADNAPTVIQQAPPLAAAPGAAGAEGAPGATAPAVNWKLLLLAAAALFLLLSNDRK